MHMRWSCSTCLCPCHRQLAQVDIGVPEMIYGAFNTNNDGVLVALDSLAMGWQVFFFGAIIAAAVVIIFILIIAIVVSFILMNKTVTNSQRPSLGPGLSLPTLIATVETLARYFHRRPDHNDYHHNDHDRDDQLSDDCVITIMTNGHGH